MYIVNQKRSSIALSIQKQIKHDYYISCTEVFMLLVRG